MASKQGKFSTKRISDKWYRVIFRFDYAFSFHFHVLIPFMSFALVVTIQYTQQHIMHIILTTDSQQP